MEEPNPKVEYGKTELIFPRKFPLSIPLNWITVIENVLMNTPQVDKRLGMYNDLAFSFLRGGTDEVKHFSQEVINVGIKRDDRFCIQKKEWSRSGKVIRDLIIGIPKLSFNYFSYNKLVTYLSLYLEDCRAEVLLRNETNEYLINNIQYYQLASTVVPFCLAINFDNLTKDDKVRDILEGQRATFVQAIVKSVRISDFILEKYEPKLSKHCSITWVSDIADILKRRLKYWIDVAQNVNAYSQYFRKISDLTDDVLVFF